MSGEEISLKHRFGGHGGVATEWEIRVDLHQYPQCRDLLRSMPKFNRVQIAALDGYARGWIDLPQGVPATLAGEITALLACGDREPLFNALLRCDTFVPPSDIEPDAQLVFDEALARDILARVEPNRNLTEMQVAQVVERIRDVRHKALDTGAEWCYSQAPVVDDDDADDYRRGQKRAVMDCVTTLRKLSGNAL